MKFNYIFNLILFFSLSLTGCESPQKKETPIAESSNMVNYDEYSDNYSNNIYMNNKIGFNMQFNKNWEIRTLYKNLMSEHQRLARSFKSQNGELLSIGSTANQILWVRMTVENLNLPEEGYFNLIEKVNQRDFLMDPPPEKKTFTVNGTKVIEWVMTAKKKVGNYRLKFVEYQFKKDTYNIRITFWTIDEVFNSLKPEIENIINSLSFFI